MSLLSLTLKRLLSRRLLSILLIVSIGLSTMLLIGIQKIKLSAKESFSKSISGTDLIVGARSGDIQLLLYTVFRQGQPVANMSWQSIQDINALPDIDWVVPISLGDSHRGYPVVGTIPAYFEHYKYNNKKPLRLRNGRFFSNTYDVVLGAEVAKQLNYTLNDTLYMSHGESKANLKTHKHNPFNVVGILKPTGTPIDKSLHIHLEGMTAIHLKPRPKHSASPPVDLTPESVTGAFIGLTSKFSIFSVQRQLTHWDNEPLMAIIPGVTLSRLWNNISVIDSSLLVISILVLIIGFMGLLLALFMSLLQRKRELLILRTLGAHPSQLFILLSLESLIITVVGVGFGIILLQSTGVFFKPFLEESLGLVLHLTNFTAVELYLALGIIVAGVLTSFFPAMMAYRQGKTHGIGSL